MFHLSRSQVGEVIYLDGNTNYKVRGDRLYLCGQLSSATCHTPP